MRELSSFDISAIVTELQKFKGSVVDKIYQIEKEDILIKLKKIVEGKTYLFARSGSFVIYTMYSFDIPKKPSNFAMILRKYLEGGVILNIEQHEFDRVIVITITRGDKKFYLIFELFSDGNIVLTDEKKIIIAPLKHQIWSHRTIKPREVYIFPPGQFNPFKANFDEFESIFKKSKRDIVRTLALDVNLGGMYAEEVCIRANIDKSYKAMNARKEDIYNLFEKLKEFLNIFLEGKLEPVRVKEENEIIDVTPLPLNIYNGLQFERIPSFIEGIESLIHFQYNHEIDKKNEEMKSLKRRFLQQKTAIENLLIESKEKKREGELLYLHYKDIDDLLRKIQSMLKKKDKDIDKITKLEFVKIFDPTENLLIIKIKDGDIEREIKLDFRKSIAENADIVYQYSKKLRNKADRAMIAMKETKEKLESIVVNGGKEKKKKNTYIRNWWFERFRWFISSYGNVVVAGKDAKSNELLIKKYMKDEDRYIHADIHGASSCILKSTDIEGKDIGISDRALGEACRFAAVYSKAWNQFGFVSVYWVFPSQVSKSPESGEYLPKGAFVIRGKRNYVRCNMEVGIGEIFIRDVRKIISGPTDVIKEKCNRYLIMQPGDLKKNIIANEIAKIFDVPVEIILSIIPGDAKIIETKGIDWKLVG